jgi:aminomethyltransferase
LEAGLGWITKFNKAFTSSTFLQKQKASGVEKKLVGFEMIDRGIPRHDYLIRDEEGNMIGKVTSGTQSPTLNKGIGMGYVMSDHAQPGSTIYIDIRDKQLKASVVKFPFVK